ncbi:MAG TPA: hypothetical protein PKW90_28025, partial [Myxococcota bacterium]|nr:hypothetical protein [Myxococcota bacterium]
IAQGDPDGDYTEMQRPVAQAHWLAQNPWTIGNLANRRFNYPAEPSWQLASSRSSSSAMPGAWTQVNHYYLWDIEPFLTGQGPLAERHAGSMRPFWLARRHGVRNAAYEERVMTFNGDPRGRPVALSTWTDWDVFRGVPGDYVMEVDSSNYGRLCAPGGGGPMDPLRHAAAGCVSVSVSDEGRRMVAEMVDAPLLVQLADSSWHRFGVQWWGAVGLAEFEAMAERSADTLSAMPGCAGGVVQGPGGRVKWFGSLRLEGGGTVPVTDIIDADRNYGAQFLIDTVTVESRQRGALLLFKPHSHDSAEAMPTTLFGAVVSSIGHQQRDTRFIPAVTYNMAASNGGTGTGLCNEVHGFTC